MTASEKPRRNCVAKVVLDASAMLALLGNEPGADKVIARLSECVISAVNLSEVYSKSIQKGHSLDRVVEQIRRLQIPTIDFADAHARQTAVMHAATRKLGISLGDCACLSLGKITGATIVTADRRWSEYSLDSLFGVELQQIRGEAIP